MIDLHMGPPCVFTHGADTDAVEALLCELSMDEIVSLPHKEAEEILGTLHNLGRGLLDLHVDVVRLTNAVQTSLEHPSVEALKRACVPLIKRFLDFADTHWKARDPCEEQIGLLEIGEQREAANVLKNEWVNNGYQFGMTTKALNWLLYLVDCLESGKELPSAMDCWAHKDIPKVVIDPGSHARPDYGMALANACRIV